MKKSNDGSWPQSTGMYMFACLWVILILLANVAFAENTFYTQARYGKREDVALAHSGASMPFFSGSRYGRSNTAAAESIKTVEISPRPDRFFLGSRYGKRKSQSSLRRLETLLDYLNGATRLDDDDDDQHRLAHNYQINHIVSYDDDNPALYDNNC